MIVEFFRDLRYGARLLRRSAVFSAIAVLSLGLGIGGSTAVFSLVNAIVLRTLPVPDPQQLYQARSQSPGREYGDLFSGPTFQHARDELSGARRRGAVRGHECRRHAAAARRRGDRRARQRAAGLGRVLHGAAPGGAARAAARAVRQRDRRRPSGRGDQRQLLEAALRRQRRTRSAGRWRSMAPASR